MRKILTKMLMFMLVLVFTACGKEEIKLENGDMGQKEYNNIVFEYIINEEGAIITKVIPESGEYLEFPEMIENQAVIDVDENCVLNYKEIVFAGLNTLNNNRNTVTKKISFHKGAKLRSTTLVCFAKKLSEVSLPEGLESVKSLGVLKDIEKVKLPVSVKTIGRGTFEDFTKLKEINLENVRTIEKEAFSGCISLAKVDIGNVEVIGENAFKDCKSLDCDIEFKKLKNLGGGAFIGCSLLEGNNIIFSSSENQGISFTPGISMEYKNISESENIREDILNEIENYKQSLPFGGIDVNIIGLGEEETRYLCMLSNRFMMVTDISFESTDDIEYGKNVENINCSKEEFFDIIIKYFDGKTLKKGDSISVNDIKPILDCIKDDDNVLMFPPYKVTATKYRLVECLSIALEGKNLSKELGYDEIMEADGTIGKYNRRYTYAPIDYSMIITNTNFEEVQFEVEKRNEDVLYIDFYTK